MHQDKAFAFVTKDKFEDIYSSVNYSVQFEYSGAKYLDFGKIQKGYSQVGVIPHNEKFKVSSVQQKDDKGHHLIIKLRQA